jgi:hypothetical protein
MPNSNAHKVPVRTRLPMDLTPLQSGGGSQFRYSATAATPSRGGSGGVCSVAGQLVDDPQSGKGASPSPSIGPEGTRLKRHPGSLGLLLADRVGGQLSSLVVLHLARIMPQSSHVLAREPWRCARHASPLDVVPSGPDPGRLHRAAAATGFHASAEPASDRWVGPMQSDRHGVLVSRVVEGPCLAAGFGGRSP